LRDGVTKIQAGGAWIADRTFRSGPNGFVGLREKKKDTGGEDLSHVSA